MMKYLDLFAGCGGLSCGLQMAGLKPLGGFDLDPVAVQTYGLNHPESAAVAADIAKLQASDILDVIGGVQPDLICGGPPCQGFSTLGKNDANDPRNALLQVFARVVADFKPDRILVENVPGLMSPRHRATLMAFLEELRDIGYSSDVRSLNAVDYGVPQRRRRTIISGNRIGAPNPFPEPCAGIATVGDAFERGIYKTDGTATDHDPRLIADELDRERLRYVPEGGQIRYERDEERMSMPRHLRYPVNWLDLPENRFREAKLHRLHRGQPSNTINTRRNTYCHPVENRHLTLREAAAIQTFPPEYEFRGSLTQKWRQVGNAVPPLLARAIGLALLDCPEGDGVRYPATITIGEKEYD